MARTTIASNTLAAATQLLSDSRNGNTVSFDTSNAGYATAPVKTSPTKPTEKRPISTDANISRPQQNIARSTIIAPRILPSSSVQQASSSLQPVGFNSTMKDAVSAQPINPAPVSAAKPPQPTITVSQTRLYGATSYDKGATHTDVNGVVEQRIIQGDIGKVKVTFSNAEHDNRVSSSTTKSNGSVVSTNQNIHTSDYQLRGDLPVNPNTKVFGIVRSSTTFTSPAVSPEKQIPDGKQTNSVIRTSIGVEQTFPLSKRSKIVATGIAFRDFGGATAGSTSLEGRAEASILVTDLTAPSKINLYAGVVGRATFIDGGASRLPVAPYVGVKASFSLASNISLDLGAKYGLEPGSNNLPTRDFGMGAGTGSRGQGEASFGVKFNF